MADGTFLVARALVTQPAEATTLLLCSDGSWEVHSHVGTGDAAWLEGGILAKLMRCSAGSRHVPGRAGTVDAAWLE